MIEKILLIFLSTLWKRPNYFIWSRLSGPEFSANLGLLFMQHPGINPYFNVLSERRRSELFWSFIWKVAHPVSDRTQPCLTSVKLMELAGPLGHSPRQYSEEIWTSVIDHTFLLHGNYFQNQLEPLRVDIRGMPFYFS